VRAASTRHASVFTAYGQPMALVAGYVLSDLLSRYRFLIGDTDTSYLWYYPAGNPGKSGPETLPSDGWGASAMLAALVEGAAGIEDQGARYEDVRLSPRWPAADLAELPLLRTIVAEAAADPALDQGYQVGLDALVEGVRVALAARV